MRGAETGHCLFDRRAAAGGCLPDCDRALPSPPRPGPMTGRQGRPGAAGTSQQLPSLAAALRGACQRSERHSAADTPAAAAAQWPSERQSVADTPAAAAAQAPPRPRARVSPRSPRRGSSRNPCSAECGRFPGGAVCGRVGPGAGSCCHHPNYPRETDRLAPCEYHLYGIVFMPFLTAAISVSWWLSQVHSDAWHDASPNLRTTV